MDVYIYTRYVCFEIRRMARIIHPIFDLEHSDEAIKLALNLNIKL